MKKSFTTINDLVEIYSCFDLLFDLDNTIYSEKQFLHQVFSQIAETFFTSSKNEVASFLRNEFKEEGRSKLYDKLLQKFPAPSVSISDILIVQRSFVRPNLLQPFEWFIKFCQLIPNGSRIMILTNGTPIQQKNKVLSLDLSRVTVSLDVFYANERSPKPSPDCLDLIPNFAVKRKGFYLGDSPIDQQFANNAGLVFIDVKPLI